MALVAGFGGGGSWCVGWLSMCNMVIKKMCINFTFSLHVSFIRCIFVSTITVNGYSIQRQSLPHENRIFYIFNPSSDELGHKLRMS